MLAFRQNSNDYKPGGVNLQKHPCARDDNGYENDNFLGISSSKASGYSLVPWAETQETLTVVSAYPDSLEANYYISR
jgi:hypothetical protein